MTPPLAPVLVTNEDGLRLVQSFLERTAVFGYDLETTVTDTYFTRRIRTIQLGDKQEQYVIDLLAFVESSEELYNCQGGYGGNLNEGLQRVRDVLQPYLEDHSRTKVGHNLQFEYEMMWWNFGLRCTGFYDTMLAEKNIWAGIVHFMTSGFWGLEDLVLRYTNLIMSKDEQKGFDLSTPLTQNQIDYCGLDVRLPMAVRIGQLRTIEKDELQRSAQIDFDAISPFGDMKIAGIYLNPEPWIGIIRDKEEKKRLVVAAMDEKLIPVVGTKAVSEAQIARRDAIEKQWKDCPNKTPEQRQERAELRKKYMLLRKQIADRSKLAPECIGEALINYSSNAQLRNSLWKMGFTKKQLPKTEDRVLESLAKFPDLTVDKAFRDDGLSGQQLTSKYVAYLSTLPIIDLLRLFRSIEKSITTYGYTWTMNYDEKDANGNKGLVCPFTGRIHSDINQFGAATGRTSSSSPNIQNIPKGSSYRHSFTARPGYKIITIDYSGCELRIMAELSGEQKWLEAFKNGWDVHSVGAEILFGQRWTDGAIEGCAYLSAHDKCKCPIHVELRSQVKAINFGLAYGMAAKKLSEELGITKAAAEELLALYFKTFPTVTKYLEQSGLNARTKRNQRTICGRRRRWKEPTWDIAKALVEAEVAEHNKKALKDPSMKQKTVRSDDIRWRLRGLFSSIEREGKNSPIQGCNADVVKRAMFLVWLYLFPKYKAFFVNMVHDELVIECPEEYAEECCKEVGGTMTEAGTEFLKLIPMTVEENIENYWSK